MGRLKRWLQAVPDMGPVDRGFIPLLLGLPVFLQILLWQVYVLGRPDRAGLINVAVVQHDVQVALAMAGLSVLLLLAGLWLRLRWPRLLAYQHVSVQFYAISMAYWGYEIGTQSFVNGVVMLSAPMVGLIILDRRVVLFGFASGLCIVIAAAFASALGYLPYAPALVPSSNSSSSLFWLLSTWYFAAAHIVVIIGLTDQILNSWRQREHDVRLLSRTDSLTGLHNRRHILDMLDIELARSERKGWPLTVIMMDLDYFKQINDSYGHLTGDRVLRAVADLLLATLRQHDAVGRYGGEEFIMLLTDTSVEGARRLAERCRERLAATSITVANGHELAISGSFGLACTEQNPGGDADLLIQQADAALYRAKAGGRNRVEVGD